VSRREPKRFHVEPQRSPRCYGCHKEPRIEGQGYGRKCKNAKERERKARVAEELKILRERYVREVRV